MTEGYSLWWNILLPMLSVGGLLWYAFSTLRQYREDIARSLREAMREIAQRADTEDLKGQVNLLHPQDGDLVIFRFPERLRPASYERLQRQIDSILSATRERADVQGVILDGPEELTCLSAERLQQMGLRKIEVNHVNKHL